MKWSISIFALVLGISGVLTALPGGKKFDWSRIKPREVWPDKSQTELRKREIELSRRFQNGRIVGGSEVSPGKYPHQVGLVIDLFYWCGGSLLSNLYVLTAAHCTDEAFEIDILLGAHNVRLEQEEGRRIETVQFRNMIQHTEYNRFTLTNDIALLMMNRRIEFTDRIQPIRLPTRTEAKWDMELWNVTASGWGRSSDNAQGITDILRSADLRVQPEVVCEHFFRGTIQKTHICTGTGQGKGTCNGDSGGPLIYKKEGSEPFVVGLTSFGSSMACVGVGWPSVFTRVGEYLNWIRDNTDIIIKD